MKDFKYLDDLQEIRQMMSRSTRFVSLSGLSGIGAGLIAIAGGGLVIWMINTFNSDPSFLGGISQVREAIIGVALVTLMLAALCALYFTRKRARASGQNLWNEYSSRLLLHLCIPLLIGGFLSFNFYLVGQVQWIPGLMLIFYGLGLLQASHFTLSDIIGMGYSQLALGCLAILIPGLGLYIWVLGFGIIHILYGIWMYHKYEK